MIEYSVWLYYMHICSRAFLQTSTDTSVTRHVNNACLRGDALQYRTPPSEGDRAIQNTHNANRDGSFGTKD